MGEWYIPASGPVQCIEGFPGSAVFGGVNDPGYPRFITAKIPSTLTLDRSARFLKDGVIEFDISEDDQEPGSFREALQGINPGKA